jgi:hypothetical protein
MATSKVARHPRGKTGVPDSFPYAALLQTAKVAKPIQPAARAVRGCGLFPVAVVRGAVCRRRTQQTKLTDQWKRRKNPCPAGTSLRFLKTYFACAHAARLWQRNAGRPPQRQFSPPSFPLQRACENTTRRGLPLPAPVPSGEAPDTSRVSKGGVCSRTGVVQ